MKHKLIPFLTALSVISLPGLCSGAAMGNLDISVNLSGAPIVTITDNSISKTVFAVPFEAKNGGSWLPSPAAGLPGTGFNKNDFFTFCTDIGVTIQSHALYRADTFTDAGSPPNPGVNPPWRQVSGSYLPAIQQAEYLFIHNYTAAFNLTGVNSAPTIRNIDMAAGLQLAIWNVLYDGDNNISSGTFHASSTDSTALTDAQNFLNDLAYQISHNSMPIYNSTWLDPRGDTPATQGLLYPPELGASTPVFDGGATVALLGFALSGLGIFGRRLRR